MPPGNRDECSQVMIGRSFSVLKTLHPTPVGLPIWFAIVIMLYLFLYKLIINNIDEIEADLHPDMIPAILDLFIDCDLNPHDAQIIFTCHVHEVLNGLQKDQVLLVEKDADGCSEAWRLGDVKGIRRDDNLYAKYRAGAYGAIPDL